MKKGLIVAVVALTVLGFTTSSFAGKYTKSGGVSYTVYEAAEVLEMLPHQGALIVKDLDDNKRVHIHVDKETQAELKVGDIISFKMQGSMCMIDRVTRK